MKNELLLSDIEKYISEFPQINDKKKYWLVRTMGGRYFESFIENNFIAIGHDEINYVQITDLKKVSKGDKDFLHKLKDLCSSAYSEEKQPGLIAGQIDRFIYKIKKGDIVVIPSENSELLAIGTIQSTPLLEFVESDITKTRCHFRKRKAVKWIKHLRRDDLDPYLFKVLQAHQAVNEITRYSDIIERTIGNFYIKENIGNLVLNVTTSNGINAVELFQLGYFLLNYSEDYFKKAKLPFDIKDIEVKINLNSKGKIQFKSLNPRIIWLIALLIIGVNGGGLKFQVEGFNFNLSTDGIIKNIIDYQNNLSDRKMTEVIMNSIDTLKIEAPDDAVKVFQQFNTNKK